MLVVKRTFYPIGQGAFYVETHIDDDGNIRNFVYDCGQMRNKEKAEKLVEKIGRAIAKSGNIDILFISHFDDDHVNLIPTLKKTLESQHKSIKLVILPLLRKEEKKLLSNIYHCSGDKDLSEFIWDPSSFFEKETKIINVYGYNENNNENNEKDQKKRGRISPISIEELDKRTNIRSGTQITLTLSKDVEWIFIPYNYKFEERSKQLKEELKKNGLKDLCSDLSCNLLKKIFNDDETRIKVRGIYTKLEGNINENSMLIYSGLNNIPYNVMCEGITLYHPDLALTVFNNAGCIYTGDCNLNKISPDAFLKKYLGSKMVGTIQIPHHGSKGSFNTKWLYTGGLRCPISYGTSNSYNHPHEDVVEDIKKKGSHRIRITEDERSEYTEIFVIR